MNRSRFLPSRERTRAKNISSARRRNKDSRISNVRHRKLSRPCVIRRPNGLGRSGSVGAVTICMEFRSDPGKSFPCKSVSNAVRHREDPCRKTRFARPEERKRERKRERERERTRAFQGGGVENLSWKVDRVIRRFRAEMIRRIIVPFA